MTRNNAWLRGSISPWLAALSVGVFLLTGVLGCRSPHAVDAACLHKLLDEVRSVYGRVLSDEDPDEINEAAMEARSRFNRMHHRLQKSLPWREIDRVVARSAGRNEDALEAVAMARHFSTSLGPATLRFLRSLQDMEDDQAYSIELLVREIEDRLRLVSAARAAVPALIPPRVRRLIADFSPRAVADYTSWRARTLVANGDGVELRILECPVVGSASSGQEECIRILIRFGDAETTGSDEDMLFVSLDPCWNVIYFYGADVGSAADMDAYGARVPTMDDVPPCDPGDDVSSEPDFED